jgi:hypothetical protein
MGLPSVVVCEYISRKIGKTTRVRKTENRTDRKQSNNGRREKKEEEMGGLGVDLVASPTDREVCQSEHWELTSTKAASVEGLQTCVVKGSRCVTTKDKQRKSDERLGGKDNGRRSNVQKGNGEGTEQREIKRGHRAEHTYSPLSMHSQTRSTWNELSRL